MDLLCYLCLLSIPAIVRGADPDDPCKTAYILKGMDQRFKENYVNDSSLWLCDRYRLGNGRWVRVDGQDLLQTEPKTNEWCGTRYPIWMIGPPPETVGEELVKDACVMGLQGPCIQTLPIKIKKCVGYNVYYLTPPSSCYKAYCFQYSAEGDVPTEVVEKPVVRYELEKSNSTGQKLKFICAFTAKDIIYYYQVVWYIEDTPVVIKDAVKNESIRNTDLGYDDKDTTKGYQKLGINIKCAVQLKLKPEGVPGPLSPLSENFFAGIRVTPTRVTLTREETQGNINVTSTVPLGCVIQSDGSADPNCFLDIEMNVPRDPKKCEPVITGVEIKNGQGVNCGLRISHTDWQMENSVNISFKDKMEYNLKRPDGSFRIGMIIGEKNESPEWSGIKLQDVYVHIEDSSDIWQGKSCSAVNDPHMRTFDGRPFRSKQQNVF